MRESVPSPRYSPVCNVLRQWKTSLILTYRVYRLYDTIHRNKLPLFSTPVSNASKGKQQLNSLKCDVELFSRLYIGCQTCDGNLDEFFRHENQACPPSLSAAGKLNLGTKSDMPVSGGSF